MKATKQKVSEAIWAKHGHKVELVKSGGYFYFSVIGADWKIEPISWASSSSVWVYRITDLDLDGWVAAYEELIEGVEIPEAHDPDKQKPIVLVSKNNVY